MALGSDIKAGAAYVELSIHNSAFVRGLRNAQRRLQAFSAATTAIGRSLLVATAVLATPLAMGTKIFASFEEQMNMVSTMLDEPEMHMDRFRSGIRRMAVDFGEGTDTLSKGLYDILSASIAPGKALGVLEVSAKAAKAGMTDTGVAADAITTILNSYGLAADHAGDVSDLLFSTVKRGKTTFAELAPSIGMVASLAASSGLSLDELGASLALMTRNGVQTETAVTALRSILGTFLKPTAEGAAYAKSLGFELSAATIQAEGMEGVFKRIAGMPPDAIAKLFPNKRAIIGVLPALRDMQGFATDLQTMAGRAGATDTAYDKMGKGLAHTFRRVREAGKLVLSVIGEALASDALKAGNVIIDLAKKFTGLIQANRQLVVTVTKVLLVAGAVGGALLAVGAAAGVVAFAVGGMASIFSVVASTIGTIGALIGAILTPIGLVAAAAIGLGVYLLRTSDIGQRAWAAFSAGIRAQLAAAGKAMSWLRDLTGSTVSGIAAALQGGDVRLAGQVLWAALTVAWRKGVDEIMGVWIDFRADLLGVWVTAKSNILRTWKATWFALKETAIKSHLAPVFLQEFHLIESGWTRIMHRMERQWLGAADVMAGVARTLVRAFRAAGEMIGGIWYEVLGFLDESLNVDALKGKLAAKGDAQAEKDDFTLAAIRLEIGKRQSATTDRQEAELTALYDRQAGRIAELNRQKALGNQGRIAELRDELAAIDVAAENAKQAIASGNAAALAKSGAALSQAQAEYRQALRAAADRRDEARHDELVAKYEGPDAEAEIAKLRAEVQAGANRVPDVAERVQVQGGFDLAANLQSLLTVGAKDTDVAKNTAEMVRKQSKTNTTLEDIRDQELEFS